MYTYGADTIFPNGKIVQQPSTHYFGTKFAKAFGVKYMDKNEKEQYVYTTAYGPAIWRILASIIALHGDDRGLIFPPKIAPVQVVIVPILFTGKEKQILARAKGLCKHLKSAGLRVELDLTEKTAGNKFYYWELRGVPLRIEVGPKEVSSKTVILARRDTGVKQRVRDRDLLSTIERANKAVLLNLRKKADALIAQSISSAKTYRELKQLIKSKGGFVRVNFCSIEKNGKPCAEKIKQDMAAEVRGFRVDKQERAIGSCIVCGKKAKHVVYIAKAY